MRFKKVTIAASKPPQTVNFQRKITTVQELAAQTAEGITHQLLQASEDVFASAPQSIANLVEGNDINLLAKDDHGIPLFHKLLELGNEDVAYEAVQKASRLSAREKQKLAILIKKKIGGKTLLERIPKFTTLRILLADMGNLGLKIETQAIARLEQFGLHQSPCKRQDSIRHYKH